LRIKIYGAEEMCLNAEGDLLMQIENAQLVLHKPALYEEISSRELPRKSAAAANPPQRYPIEGAYLFEPDGSIGFRIARRHPHAALVIDPSLSITYSTFLGGAGEDSANSIAADSTGKLYIGGKHAGPRIAIAAHVSPQIAIAATLETALILSILSCGSKTPPLPPSGTPANTYTLTLSASTPGGPPPTTQGLTLTIQ
jgi:hypothetical protein